MPPNQVAQFVLQLPACSTPRVPRLMTLARMSSGPARIRSCFALLRGLRQRLRADGVVALDELSMGMSGDFEIAIEEDAAVVRTGEAMYGARGLPDSYFGHNRHESILERSKSFDNE